MSLEQALSHLQGPDRDGARGGGHRGHRGPAAGPAHARLRVQQPAPGQGGEGPPALLPELDRLAQPGQRGQRRVRGGPDRGGALALRAGPALVPPEGAAARPRPPRLLGSRRTGGPVGRAHPLRRGPVDRARLLLRVLPRARCGGRRVLRGRVHRRAAPAGQARRRLLLLHGAERAPVRDAQLHLAPARRAHDGPRARPRRARRAGAPAGDLPVHHPADGRRDGLDLRRDDRARPPAPARPGRSRAARPAGRVAGRRRRRGVPPDRDEPLRARACTPSAARAESCPPTASPSCGSRPRPSCSATRSS